jgi:leucyl/phenylalanyl-tRNA--protein transferase
MFWLAHSDTFPPAGDAPADEPLAIGLGLSPQKILNAYRHGIFPWASEGELVSWWSPDPRMVLFTDKFRCSRSLRKTIRSGKFEVRRDTSFTQVMQACATIERHDQAGSWITPDFISAYSDLFSMGYAHCFESFRDNALVGGLYGLLIGKMFFGESMFAYETDASKVAFAAMIEWLSGLGVTVIDCQQETRHLTSLGGETISREAFLEIVEEKTKE